MLTGRGSPKLSRRKSSGTMIVPADSPDIELKEETYPPYDARAMSPRRSSAETDRMIAASRQAVQEYVLTLFIGMIRDCADRVRSHALELQSGLDALVNKLEDVQINHDTLQKNNVALQDYIGGLTRSMSKSTDLSSTGRKK